MIGCGCRFCTELQRLAIRRRDPALLEAAMRLREAHAANEAEREAFARSGARRVATQQMPESSTRMAIPGGNGR